MRPPASLVSEKTKKELTKRPIPLKAPRSSRPKPSLDSLLLKYTLARNEWQYVTGLSLYK